MFCIYLYVHVYVIMLLNLKLFNMFDISILKAGKLSAAIKLWKRNGVDNFSKVHFGPLLLK